MANVISKLVSFCRFVLLSYLFRIIYIYGTIKADFSENRISLAVNYAKLCTTR